MHRFLELNQKLSWTAISAIETGNVTALASAITDAQGVFDNCAIENCPSELRSPKLHSVMSDSRLKRHVLAVKGVGSQGDGSVQMLCRSEAEQRLALAVLRDELGLDGFMLTVPASPSPSPSPERPLLSPLRCRCALVIADPAAVKRFSSLGSSCPPCLMPIPFLHGTKPLLTSLLQELLSAGM